MDTIIRKTLLSFLSERNAHRTYEEVLEDYPRQLINKKLENVDYTPWQLLEHMRITQYDILDFVTNTDYVQPSWPEGYWPKQQEATYEDWQKSYHAFVEDLTSIKNLVTDPQVDLFRPMPAGEKYTLFREVLVIIDHNACHLGQLILFKKSLAL